MGTDDLDQRLYYSMISNIILKYIKDTEEESVHNTMSGLRKKEIVLQLVSKNASINKDNMILIDVMIDALIAVSNNPSLIRAEHVCPKAIFLCCGC